MSTFQAERIVVPIDFSADSTRAVAAALDIADRAQNVHVVHVLQQLDTVSPGVLWDQVDDASRESAVREQFEKLGAEHDIPDVDFTVKFGDPGLVIADYAQEINADLIVIPTHGYHGVARFVLGSVAERVIRHASCSVLALRRSDAK